jgi:hypothetical protein
MASSTSGVVYAKASCRYCSDELSVNALARHELVCKDSTPEKREERKAARIKRYQEFLKKRPKEMKQRTKACKFCGDEIGSGSILRHEAKCETQTPQERDAAKQQRAYQQTYYGKQKGGNRERYQQSMRVPYNATASASLDEPVVPDKRSYQHHYAVGANGKPISKPMSISMLVDEDNLALALGRVVIQKLPELLPQLIPGLAIEAFATKSHRAGKV